MTIIRGIFKDFTCSVVYLHKFGSLILGFLKKYVNHLSETKAVIFEVMP